MADQAEALRQLVLQTGPPADRLAGRVLLVVGARPAVGATTLSGHLALLLQRHGRPTALVDADLDQPTLLARWGVSAHYSLADLATGERAVREVLQPGPGGLSMLGGCLRTDLAAGEAGAGAAVAGALRLLASRCHLVIDAGRGDVWEELYRLADALLLITTADQESLREAYACLKRVSAQHTAARFWVIMNQTRDVAIARRGQQRLIDAADRFLNLEVCPGGELPAERSPATDPTCRPVLPPASGMFRRKLERLVVRWFEEVGQLRHNRPVAGEKSEKSESSSVDQPISSPSLFAPAGVNL